MVWPAGAVQTLVDNVVATGLRVRSMPDYRALGRDRTWSAEWTREVESKFSHYANRVEFVQPDGFQKSEGWD